MTRYHHVAGVQRAERQEFALTAATVSPTFTGSVHTTAWYNNAAIVGTVEASLDGGTTWFSVGSSTAKTGCQVVTTAIFSPYAGLAGIAGAFRISFASAFTGTLVVEGCNV